MGVFVPGPFLSKNGVTLPLKVECDALDINDWLTIRDMVVEEVGPFTSVEGIPTGGSLLADLLEKYRRVGSYPRLIVDDVWTTGSSMRARRAELPEKADVIGCVVFAHRQPDDWVRALWVRG